MTKPKLRQGIARDHETWDTETGKKDPAREFDCTSDG